MDSSLNLFGRNAFTLQDDRAPCHRAQFVKDFIKKKIACFDWPPQSSDLNTTENLWYLLKKKVRNGQKIFSNIYRPESKDYQCLAPGN